jgi:hypothetical protein
MERDEAGTMCQKSNDDAEAECFALTNHHVATTDKHQARRATIDFGTDEPNNQLPSNG